jgi:hypothetical protein
MDYVLPGMFVRIFIRQPDGSFKNTTTIVDADAFGVWPADIEMDGDVDLVIGKRGSEPMVLRNNGDGGSKLIHPFAGVSGARAFAWGDVDGDGDPDAVFVGEKGDLHVFENRQAGEFRRIPAARASVVVAMAVGDANGDGVLDIVTLDACGRHPRDVGSQRRMEIGSDRPLAGSDPGRCCWRLSSLRRGSRQQRRARCRRLRRRKDARVTVARRRRSNWTPRSPQLPTSTTTGCWIPSRATPCSSEGHQGLPLAGAAAAGVQPSRRSTDQFVRRRRRDRDRSGC